MTSQPSYDVVVVGGGPAGSAAASVLAASGRRVAMLEREKFPRYHIGESLLPFCWFPLERIGMLEKMNASRFTRKHSVQFVSPEGRLSIPFYFHKHFDHPASQTWQVLRSEFDQMLMDNARERGAEVFERMTARELLRDGEAVTGVRAVDEHGATREFAAPMTVDATGRDAFAVSRNGWKVRDQHLNNKIAIWSYWQGAMRDAGIDEGATTIAFVPEKGWFWYIPLAGNMVSVGVVAEKEYLYGEGRDLETILHREIRKNPWVEQHVTAGKQSGQYYVTGEYSYRSRYSACDGLVLAGDAFGFLDPVFSSGVYLALKSGVMVADAVNGALTAGDISASRFTAYSEDLRTEIDAMRRLVYAFYTESFSFKDFCMDFPQHRGLVTDCLIGNLSLDFTQMFADLTKYAQAPPPVPHGLPLVSAAATSQLSAMGD